MRTPRKEIIERLREDFPVGCRVELLKMDDDQAPPVGTLGTVVGVDAIGTIHTAAALESPTGKTTAGGSTDGCKIHSFRPRSLCRLRSELTGYMCGKE